MSEYQYYEFRAIDKPLTKAQQEDMRELSSRAEITARSFVNVYNYGDFRGNPRWLMENYYDAYVYISNFGVREFSLRLPKSVLDPKIAKRYCSSSSAETRVKGSYIILHFGYSDEPPNYGWEEGEGWMDLLLGVREELAQGDLRSLYLGWLVGAYLQEHKLDAKEPEVPPGLKKLTKAQSTLAELLWVDDNLLKEAAKNSPALPAPAAATIKAKLKKLPAKRKDELLCKVYKGGGQEVQQLLQTELRQQLAPAASGKKRPLRTVQSLLEAAGLGS